MLLLNDSFCAASDLPARTPAVWIAEETTTEHRWKKFRTLFIVAAIVGVAGEWIADIAVFALSEHLQTISDKEVVRIKRDTQRLATDEANSRKTIAEARRDASNARAVAAQAELNLAEANARAAEAIKKAEEDRLARLKIEQQLKPRH